MLSGYRHTLSYVLGVKKPFNDLLGAILCHAYVEKRFAICVRDLGSLITKIISNVIFTRKNRMKWKIDKNKFYKR
jgi:hypothetical protein